MEITDKAFQELVFEPYVEIERGTVVQQLTSNNRKCLQRPSKSCCVITGYVALICILVGVFAVYEGKYWWRYSHRPGWLVLKLVGTIKEIRNICLNVGSFFKTMFCTIFNWHNLVVPSADFQANLSWRHLKIVAFEDQAKHCFKNESTLTIDFSFHLKSSVFIFFQSSYFFY